MTNIIGVFFILSLLTSCSLYKSSGRKNLESSGVPPGSPLSSLVETQAIIEPSVQNNIAPKIINLNAPLVNTINSQTFIAKSLDLKTQFECSPQEDSGVENSTIYLEPQDFESLQKIWNPSTKLHCVTREN